MKHIEQITSEQAISEINRLALSDDMLTTALSEPYAQATGIEVQPSAPVTSDVEEMPSWMAYLLRKMFCTTVTIFRGVSLLSEFRAVYGWLRDRLKGSADGTIPSIILATNKPMSEHLRLLDNRKISNGNNSEIEDGVSLVRLLASQESLGKITELIDDNKDWIMDKDLPDSLTASITKATLCFNELLIESGKATKFFPSSKLEELHLPYAKSIVSKLTHGPRVLQDSTNLRILDFPKLETLNLSGGDGGRNGLWNIKGEDTMVFPSLKALWNKSNSNMIENWADCRVLKFPVMETIPYIANVTWLSNMPILEELHMPLFRKLDGMAGWPCLVKACPKLRKVILGVLEWSMSQSGGTSDFLRDCPQMIYLEVGQNVNTSLRFQAWIPTMALRTDTTAEDYVDLREDMSFANNLEQFLYNFQTFLVDRLADRTGQSALTLTLSAEVYAALEAQDGQTILATLTNKNWTVTTA